MRTSHAGWYVAAVTLVATALGAVVYSAAPSATSTSLADAGLLLVLAAAAEMMSFALPRSATGSMAFIPYFALAVVAPTWSTVVAVCAFRALAELWQRRAPLKAVFNVSSHGVMESMAILAYLATGGIPLRLVAGVTQVTSVTREVGAQALLAAAAGLTVNGILVTYAVAVSSGRRFRAVWFENNRSTIGADLLATPLVFIFAWVYGAFGVIATATLWIPILGLRQLQRTNLELEQTNEELLELMVKSLEARDPYTSGHSRRVQDFSVVIARAIGLGEREAREVGQAALLHDVGKIHEKYAGVLSKQGPLTSEEWAMIRDHPEDGASLVATMSRLRDIVPAIRHHHENWDGTGYPHGLAGESIPVASRIIRFADTLDAMTSERPYRRPMTEGAVRSEFLRCRGAQFDPAIADQLLSSAMWGLLFEHRRDAGGGIRELKLEKRRRRLFARRA